MRMIIDTDTGSDDAVAMLMALANPDVSVELVTTVAGNVPLEQATHNALVTLALADRLDVPFHVGCGAPLVRPLVTAQDVHGADGMGETNFPAPDRAPDPGHAVDAIRKLIGDHPGEFTLVTLGPLTNIAAALAVEPDLLTRCKHTYAMAGAPDAVGNINACGEFNVYADPEAAEVVFTAPGPKTMIGWNVSRQYAVIDDDLQERILGLGSSYGQFAHDISRSIDVFCKNLGLAGYDLPDPIAMAVALDPSIATETESARLHIAMSDDDTRGLSYLDRRPATDEPERETTVVWEADEARFHAMLIEALASR